MNQKINILVLNKTASLLANLYNGIIKICLRLKKDLFTIK